MESSHIRYSKVSDHAKIISGGAFFFFLSTKKVQLIGQYCDDLVLYLCLFCLRYFEPHLQDVRFPGNASVKKKNVEMEFIFVPLNTETNLKNKNTSKLLVIASSFSSNCSL